jgi:hypothetical protein
VTHWLRSSFCDTGQCLEVGWKKSSFCGEAGCIEASVRHADKVILVRNSTSPDLEPIKFTPVQWKLFLDGVKGDGPMWAWFRDQDDIIYTSDEAWAFRAGVLAGEFDLENLLHIDED